MTTAAIRQKYLAFFKEKKHAIVPATSLIRKEDSSLLFVNSGMVPFKSLFLGNEVAVTKRVANSQHCLRVTGKHNDLEEVGHDTYHHTLFEMLGNWSFGDYFKKEAIAWAWELLTKIYNLPQDRLYVTIFGGDTGMQLPADNEAAKLWTAHLPTARILPFGAGDNFWEMGPQGPCGPCAEIHIDLRSDKERAIIDAKALVNTGHPEVIELWNLVFMQYNRLASGTLMPLPTKHIDTGMGLERLAMVLQEKKATYDTDGFTDLLDQVSIKADTTYGKNEKTDIALRVVADHMRAITCAIADGQLPGATQAGYVIRRLLRRATRYSYTYLQLKEPYLYDLVPLVTKKLAATVPNLLTQEKHVSKLILQEEEAFLRTLGQGLKRINQYTKKLEKPILDGKTAFTLYDTYGFPPDLTALIAREKGLSFDKKGFEKAMQVQRHRSKAAAHTIATDWKEMNSSVDEVPFVGYDTLQISTRIVRYRACTINQQKHYQIVLRQTPFYPEGGGQVGDVGHLQIGTMLIPVWDTRKENGQIVHYTSDAFAKIASEALEHEVLASVDEQKRIGAACHHTATHLLGQALVEVLGQHVVQKGSLVNAEALRFDFSHTQALTQKELKAVTKRVNTLIRLNIPLQEKRGVPLAEAQAQGAKGIFTEKYGSHVRVVAFGKGSMELCGGTHALATGNLGCFVITRQASVAAGVRRITALAGEAAMRFIDNRFTILEETASLLKQPKDIIKAISRLQSEGKAAKKQLQIYDEYVTQQVYTRLQPHMLHAPTGTVLVQRCTVPSMAVLQRLAQLMQQKHADLYMVLAATVGKQPSIAVTMSSAWQQVLGKNAHEMVKILADLIKGGGGGKAHVAFATGKHLNGLEKVLHKASAGLTS